MTELTEMTEKLKKTPLFRGMSCEEIAEALELLRAVRKSFRSGETIFYEGDPAQYAGIVVNGSIQVVRDDADGNRDVINSMSAPGLFGEALCFCGEEYLNISVLAKEDCEILLLRLKDAELEGSLPGSVRRKLLENLLAEISSKVLFLTQKNSIMSKRTTAKKLMAFFGNESKRRGSNEFEIEYTRQELADFLGVERSAMITELSKLKKEGKVLITGRRVILPKTQ